MQVTVPDGVQPGMMFQINTPTGAMQVTCPQDTKPGMQMIVNVPMPVAQPQVVMAQPMEPPVVMAQVLNPPAPQPMVMQAAPQPMVKPDFYGVKAHVRAPYFFLRWW